MKSKNLAQILQLKDPSVNFGFGMSDFGRDAMHCVSTCRNPKSQIRNHFTPSVWKGIFLVFLFFTQMSFAQTAKFSLLVFSKTAAFRHESIGAGKVALGKMAKDKVFSANFTEDAALFNEKELQKYNAVVFLNTTGDVLNNGA